MLPVSATHRNPALVLHIVHRLGTGGMENGLVNLINHMPSDRYRHAVVSLTEITDFRDRIQARNVPIYSLHKRPGQDFNVYSRLLRLLRRLRPDIVHTRNLGTLECLVPAAIAGICVRIHGEHGRDVYDLDGLSFKYNLLRRALRPLIHRYVAVSSELASWLVDTVGIRSDRVSRICNGVDIERFHPRNNNRLAFGPDGFATPFTTVVGTVGRMEAVKDTLTLVRAFLRLISADVNAVKGVRLAIIGDGRLREEAERLTRSAGAGNLAWFAGERNDIPEIMRGLDLFVLPSLREGISNTILEAMASGLPVIATRVGGNLELVEEGETGVLVPPADPLAMAEAIRTYVREPSLLLRHGQAGRKRAETKFNLESMVDGYMAVYDAVLKSKAPGAAL